MQPSLVVSTHAVQVEDVADLIALLPAQGGLSWVRRGEGLVAGGLSAQLETAGPTRFADAGKWWTELVGRAEVVDEVHEPGTGLISFGSFGFASEPGDSVLIVPRWVVGRRGPVAWFTSIGVAGEPALTLAEIRAAALAGDLSGEIDRSAPGAQLVSRPVLEAGPGSLSEEAWKARVAEATARINAGELEKVVLARDITATCTGPLDVRTPLTYLAANYLMCWTFHVDGLFGATPELLVRRERGLVTSRVLAGTIRRTGVAEADDRLAGELSRSSKDLEEHEYAVRSVADALEPHCSSMNVPEAPFVLHLPNVMHLATDVTGVARDGITSLELAAALHPSAAVGGTPRADAVALIAEIEGMDRGRYAAPVGWMDAAGDGEWGIALRSAAIETNAASETDATALTRVRLFAGCGVVGSSDPASELAESQAKLIPIRAALGL